MLPHEVEYFSALFAPFADHELGQFSRGGKSFTYVRKQSIENRLDEVCGPNGWWVEYKETKEGQLCSLWIMVPGDKPGVWEWRHKSDGGGEREMGQYDRQGEWQADEESEAKSGYTSAFKRAAATWGITRRYYGLGMPRWLEGSGHRKGSDPAPRNPAPASRVEQPPPGQSKWDNFKLPRPGKQVFAWAREMEKYYQVTLVERMKDEAKSRSWTTNVVEWNEDQVRTIFLATVYFIQSLTNYNGEYESLLKHELGLAEGGDRVLALRKQVKDELTGYLQRLYKREPETAELRILFSSLAGELSGVEVKSGLRECVDVGLMQKIIDEVHRMIAAGEVGE